MLLTFLLGVKVIDWMIYNGLSTTPGHVRRIIGGKKNNAAASIDNNRKAKNNTTFGPFVKV